MNKSFHIHEPDAAIRTALERKINHLNKPLGSLGRLEELALQIGLIQQSTEPTLHHPCHLLFGADHGIENEGVSLSPREITWQQMINFTQGGGGVNIFCRQHHFELYLVDVGVDYDLSAYPAILNRKIAYGTKNFKYEGAMTDDQANKCISIGAKMVTECYDKGCNVISIGEMGIGNTSPSSVWMHILTQIPLEECVGAGAGLNTDGIRHKLNVLEEAVRHFWETHPYYQTNCCQPSFYEDVMKWFGGFEMVAAIGAMLKAAELKMVILVDGFIMTACMLMATKLYPSVRDYAIFCHEGNEAGHKKMLHSLNAKGLLNLGLRLGEGTGALCAYPLLESAIRMMNEMNSFENANITKYF